MKGRQHDIRVVHVLCKGRSGSTLLDRLLGERADAFSAGELRRFWELYLDGGRHRCSCGRLVADCGVWRDVARDPAVAAALGRRHAERIGRQSRPRVLAGWLRRVRQRSDDASALYAAVGRVTGAATIIDSSKSLTAFGSAALGRGVAVSVVHLVRDPRAVAHSWSRSKPLVDRRGEGLQRRGAVDSAVTWLAKNLAVELAVPMAARRSVRVRYEQLASEPGETVAVIGRELGLAMRTAPAPPSESHQIAGNPARFDTAPAIRPDRRWVAESPRWRRRAVMALTWPLAVLYGYR